MPPPHQGRFDYKGSGEEILNNKNNISSSSNVIILILIIIIKIILQSGFIPIFPSLRLTRSEATLTHFGFASLNNSIKRCIVFPVSIMSSTTRTVFPFRRSRLSPPITLIVPVEESFYPNLCKIILQFLALLSVKHVRWHYWERYGSNILKYILEEIILSNNYNTVKNIPPKKSKNLIFKKNYK